MRTDIKIDTKLNDIVLQNTYKSKQCEFQWIKEDDLAIYAQITLPKDIDSKKLQETGVLVTIPYTPVYKFMRIRFVKSNTHIYNPSTGKEWFDVYAKIYNCTEKQLYASELVIIHRHTYCVSINNNQVYIWSSLSSDFTNSPANIQNRNLLLQCVPSNTYRYPTSGVGLIKYINANLGQSDLAERLQSEFAAEKVRVVNAAFNSTTGHLDLDLDFSEADESV